jgi:hypothetical protein
MWSQEEKFKYFAIHYAERIARKENAKVFDEHFFSEQHPALSARALTCARNQCDFVAGTCAAYQEATKDVVWARSVGIGTGEEAVPTSDTIEGETSPVTRNRGCLSEEAIREMTGGDCSVREAQKIAKLIMDYRKGDDDASDDEGEEKQKTYGGPTTAARIMMVRDSLGDDEDALDLFDLYWTYLLDPTNTKTRPPSIVLNQGCAGCGKTTVLKAILKCADILGRKTLKTAFNHTNSIAIGGITTGTLISLKA